MVAKQLSGGVHKIKSFLFNLESVVQLQTSTEEIRNVIVYLSILNSEGWAWRFSPLLSEDRSLTQVSCSQEF